MLSMVGIKLPKNLFIDIRSKAGCVMKYNNLFVRVCIFGLLINVSCIMPSKNMSSKVNTTLRRFHIKQ